MLILVLRTYRECFPPLELTGYVYKQEIQLGVKLCKYLDKIQLTFYSVCVYYYIM